MIYSNMEHLGATPSLLGFGCMRFPTTPEGKIDRPRTQHMFDIAYEGGVRYFDTAYPYHSGESEPVTGECLKKYDRKSIHIATKLPIWMVRDLPHALEIFEEQLAHLQTDYVDFYLFHALDAERWNKIKELNLIPAFEKLQREGKIRHLGFSFHDDYPVFEEIITHRAWDFCQLQINYMDIDSQQGLMGYALCEQLGVPVIVMEPVKGGSLANLPDDVAAPLRALRPEDSITAWALRYVAALPNVKVILSGMSQEDHVRDNLHTFNDFHPLTPDEMRTLCNTVRAIRARVKNDCTGCRYCMPCPFGVDIPRNFALWNTHGMYANDAATRFDYANLKEEARADHCKKCGKCESACPQKIAIRADLDRVAQELGAL